uniref:Host-nuclease inhibitor protein Gam n=1 Tax=uncultured bacterium fosmid pJB16B1 TaxID=1478054 RepID=A0A0H3U7G5_9BACT|nr:hypothetical protein [uncultured bacterium fosmid pJB16B1]
MAIIKKKKAAGFKTREEFEAAVDRMAKLYVQVQKDEAALKGRHQALDDKYQPEIKAQKDEISELYDNAEVYFKEHASDLCKPGTKQGETKLAFFGVKVGMPTVIKHTREALKAIAARWFADVNLKAFVRAAPEVDKDGILAVFRDEKRVEEQNLIRAQGFTVEQEPQEFWVRPRAEDQVKQS